MIILLTTISVCEGMCGYFSLLSVFVRACVVILLTTVSVCEGVCGLTSHYCQCL